MMRWLCAHGGPPDDAVVVVAFGMGRGRLETKSQKRLAASLQAFT